MRAVQLESFSIISNFYGKGDPNFHAAVSTDNIETVYFGELSNLRGGNKSDGGGKGKGANKDTTGSGTGTGNSDSGDILGSYTSGGEASSSFNIEIIFEGTWTYELQQAFIDAADYLSTVIVGDVIDASAVQAGYGDTIDDVRIFASLEYIDGTSGVLAQAGPTYVRFSQEDFLLPTESVLKLDVADAEAKLSSGDLYQVVLHEMMHALGFGSTWDVMGLIEIGEDGILRFTGSNATEAYIASELSDGDAYAINGVPVQEAGGMGSTTGHWDESVFDIELMTATLDPGAYLSDISVAALEDMGYDTIYGGYEGADMLIF